MKANTMRNLRALAALAFGATASLAEPAVPPPAVLLAAGDIALCSNLAGADATAALLDAVPGTIAPLGDLAYPDGRSTDFQCFDRTWGRFKSRMRPSPGNHEYHTAKAADYFAYFGAGAGDPGKGFYSYELGSWHVVALNSNCAEIGGCQAGSPEETWLREDLRLHAASCTLAYWHHPLFSSGENQPRPASRDETDLQALYDAGAEIVLNNHEHNYERFAPQDPRRGRTRAPAFANRRGYSGKDFDPLPGLTPTARCRDDTFGVLKLRSGQRLRLGVSADRRQDLSDRGRGACHSAPLSRAKPAQSQPLRLNMP